MLGAIAGDIIGSVYEGFGTKAKDFPLFAAGCQFTDDTVLTVAVADCILNDKDFTETLQDYGRKYPHAGYGGTFYHWIFSKDPEPYNSWGNGSAMRVSPIGFAYNNLEQVLTRAEKSATATHNHPEGIKGAQATATAVFLARTGNKKDRIREYITEKFGYDLNRSIDAIRPHYSFDVSCQGSVPEAIIAFLDSTDFEDAIRNAISLGGDSDTQACIAGGIAQAFYGVVPEKIAVEVKSRLDPPLQKVLADFEEKFC